MSHADLVGRSEESRALRALLTRARNGLSGSIVLRGDPGIGKTALLDSVTAALADIDVIRSDGFEAELTMPYAALQRVGRPLLGHLGALPERQRQALAVAWGADGPAPDRYLVGLGMLGLFAAAGNVRPVVCVIDDAHWVDSESRDVLAFVARRLQAESTVLLFAARDSPDADTQWAGIPELRIEGLVTHAAIELLSTSAAGTVDPYVATQIAMATGGNPLALTDLARDLTIGQLSQLSLSADPVPIGSQLEAHYLRLVWQLSEPGQEWLLLAAAEQTGNPELINGAASALGIPPGCGADAERAGLIRKSDAITFRHPLVRSAVYGATPGSQRRRAHAALASEARRLGLDAVEVWHAAQATPDADPDVADRLEAVAEKAARRGGLASQARLLARAAQHTPAGRLRNGRLLSAAEAAGAVGAAYLSQELLGRINLDQLNPVQRGRLITARTEQAIFLADPEPIMASAATMLQAVEQFHGVAPELERRALVRAFECAFVADLLMHGTTLEELGARLDAGADGLDHQEALVLRGLAAHTRLPYAEAAPALRATLDVFDELDDDALSQFGFVGVTLTTALFDERAGRNYLDRLARIAGDAGALRALDTVLWIRSLFELDHGDPAAGGRYVKQVRELRRAIGYEAENVVNVAHLAWTGTPVADLELIADAVKAMGFGGVYRSAVTALGIRDIAECRYQQAFARLKPMIEQSMLQVTYIRLADFVEAAVRSEHRTEAEETATELTAMAAESRTPWIRGLDERCRALLATKDTAEGHYLRAIELLSGADVPADLGRAHLLYGEWLRRLRRRRDAREQLQLAIDIFDRIEAPAFGERARTELSATGAKIRDRRVVSGVELSPQETAVAQMAAAGKTNAEIGTALFISANTVDYHLRKVFAKLGISSRRQLSDHFDQS